MKRNSVFKLGLVELTAKLTTYLANKSEWRTANLLTIKVIKLEPITLKERILMYVGQIKR